MMQLAGLLEHAVEGGLRCEINPFVQQVRHGLARWQLAVGRTVAQLDNPLLLRRGQLVGGGWPDCCGALVILHSPVAIPATIGAQTGTRFSTGLVQTGTVLVRLL